MYLLDTNIYISFYERYYPEKNFPTFWKKFTPILQEKVVVPDIVVAENQHNPWFRQKYLKENYTQDFIKHKNYSNEWAEVLQYISESDYYSEKALSSQKAWTHESIADGWIIAIAKKENYTIVTDEDRNINLSVHQPAKNPKIPDVADALGVKCINRLKFFDEVNLKV